MATQQVEACCWVVILLAVAGVLIGAFAFVHPVQVTVNAASLVRIATAAPAGNVTSTGNGTAAASLTYSLSLVVSVYNPNWAMQVWCTAPLDVELRFRDWAFDLIRVADAADWRQIGPQGMVSRRSTTAHVGMPVPEALRTHVVKELARENAAGVFGIELVVTGQFKYEAHPHKRSLRVICPLKLALSTGTSRPAFASAVCT